MQIADVDGPSLVGCWQMSDPIVCYQMSGLFARVKPAGPDGVRYARSKHISGIGDASVIFGSSRVSTDWSFPSHAPCKFVGYPPGGAVCRSQVKRRS